MIPTLVAALVQPFRLGHDGGVSTERAGAAGHGLGVRLITVAVCTGLAAGVAGVLLTLLLHLVQHLAFGYTEATFLTGVERASPLRRVLALGVGGLVVGLGWWALRRWTAPLSSIDDAVRDGTGRLPLREATAEGVLQIVAVGCGASLGREGAPRLLGAALAGWLADRTGLGSTQRRTVLACGAGAGLASVYNVPLGGALFTLEILLMSAALREVIPALISSAVATAVAWPVLSSRPTYLVAPVSLHPNEIVFAAALGPIAGLLAVGFVRLAAAARRAAPTGWRLPIVVTVVFAGLGAVAIAYPALLGNGKGPAQLALDGSTSLLLLATLILLKPIATAACLASGANGGLLTPALAIGALLGALAGGGFSMLWPGTPVAAFAMIGAAAVLAAAQRAPLCAIVLVLEFTQTGLTLLLPLGIAVGGAMLVAERLRAAPLSGVKPG
ncbi:H+/Cl- antiporter ClcA [Nakamurella sp. UYEF19]|uniref:chloride channel protein n=1 Tax=Nakamurella sp. UYEF19 TaxID=1756392 RepID=UPI0033916766